MYINCIYEYVYSSLALANANGFLRQKITANSTCLVLKLTRSVVFMYTE